MSTSAFDHPLLSQLVGDAEAARHLTAEAELAQMLAFELALAEAEAEEGVIPAASAQHIAERLHGFVPDIAGIGAATARDGVSAVEFVHQLRQRVGPPHDRHVHFGATSQDVVDTALVLRLRPLLQLFERRIDTLEQRLAALDSDFGRHMLMGRTRLQEALPIRVADRLDSWRAPLPRHRQRLAELRPRLLLLQFGGPVGTLEQLGDKGGAVAAQLARRLDLGLPAHAWHSQRDGLVELAGWLSLLAGSLGKIGADIGLMAQNAVGEIRLVGGGASSSMPHKANPVAAELLVALARFNAAQLGGMAGTMVHEQERSGAAWTLEWLLLPPMLTATAAGLRTAIALLDGVIAIGTPR